MSIHYANELFIVGSIRFIYQRFLSKINHFECSVSLFRKYLMTKRQFSVVSKLEAIVDYNVILPQMVHFIFRLEKKMWKKEKMFVKSIFSFFHNVLMFQKAFSPHSFKVGNVRLRVKEKQIITVISYIELFIVCKFGCKNRMKQEGNINDENAK